MRDKFSWVVLLVSSELTHMASIIWQVDWGWKSQMLVVLDVDWAILSSGLLVLKDDGCFRAAGRMTSHAALPGTILVLAMKVPYHRRLPGESGWLVILAA